MSFSQQQQPAEANELSLYAKLKNEDSVNLSKESTDNELEATTTQTDEQIASLLDLPQSDEGALNQVKQFEEAFYKYYVDSSQNSDGNFDKYLSSGLKLISLIPEQNAQSEIDKKSVILSSTDTGKKTLVIDLDETLIHSDMDYKYQKHDEILTFTSDENEDVNLPIILRPGLRDFLAFVSTYFELVIFTASYRNYADAILDYIERDQKYFTRRLYRDSCLFLSPGIYIKDLSIFANRSIRNIVMIDNSIFSFANQLDNGILVTSFYNDSQDTFLTNLIDYLHYMIIPSDDVREVNRSNFRLSEYKAEIMKQD